MALFIDGGISTLEDLTAQDSQLLDVASVEGIDVTQKLGLADAELALDLEMLLAKAAGPIDRFWITNPPGLENVVCTPALKLWHTHTTLALVYADAYFSQLNDRYKAKRDQFRESAKWAREKLMQLGVGIATDPVPQAKTPELAGTAGGSMPSGTYYVATAWTNASGGEGRCGLPATFTATSTVSTLEVHPGPAPTGAKGWNVYVGNDPGSLTRQNEAPIDPNGAWRQTAAPAEDGVSPGDGQGPDYMQWLPFFLQRG
jgi:hypothetical protein